MNETRIYADAFETRFASPKEMLDFLAERAKAATWIRKPTRSLRLVPISQEAAHMEDSSGSDWEDILKDTEKNTQLALKVRGETYPVRDCAIKTILDRAGISGAGLRKLEKSNYAKVVNYCLKVAKGDALIKIADGKVSAVHGGDSHDYSILDMRAVFETTMQYLDANFKGSSYMEGSGAFDHNVTKAEANQQIRETLNLGQYRDDYQRPARQERDLESPTPVNSERASDREIDQTYSQMLSMLTLSRKHQEDLQKRGLTLEQIAAQRYRSVPLFGIKKLVERLADKGCTLRGVPGFYQGEDGAWSIHFTAKNSGILIPILSIKGLIQGFQIRLDFVTDSRKYIWLSSANYQMGVSSGSPVHVIGNLDAETMYVTEGALKGTIAHYLSGDTFLCAPGVNQYRSIHPVLERLSRRNLKLVYEAYDMDKKMQVNCNGHHKKCGECLEAGIHDYCPFKMKKREIIQNGCKKLYEGCRSLSLPVQRMIWDMDENSEWCGRIKGIDDFYYATRRNMAKQ